IEQDLLAAPSIVNDQSAAAFQAHDELVLSAMRMLPAHVSCRHVVDHEHPPRLEDDLAPRLCGDETAANVFERRQPVNRHAADPRGRGAGWRNVRFGGWLRWYVDIPRDMRRVADDDRIRRHIARHDGADAHHRVRPDGDATQDRGIRANRGCSAYHGRRDSLRTTTASRP